MTFYIIASIIMFIAIASVVYGLIKSFLSKKDDKKMYYFIRNFKNGPIFYVYILLFFVFLIGVLKNNMGLHNDFFYDIFRSITDSLVMTVEAIVFKYQLDGVKVLMDNLFIYRLLVFTIFALSAFSSFIFVASFFGKNLYNNKRLDVALNKENLYVVIGFNKDNYKLLDQEKNIIFVDCVATEEKDSKVRKARIDGIKEELYLSNITFKILDDYSDIPVFINDLTEKNYKDLRVIVNTGDESLNVNLINEFYKNDSDQNPTLSLDDLNLLNYYVFGSSKYSSIYNNLIEKSKGRIHFINQEKMIADSFEYNYPLTRYMDNRHIDYKTGTLRNDVDVNVFMVGFGNVNKELFLNSVRNNQFITLNKDEKNNITELHKAVNYYIFEKEANNNIDNNLNFTYFRFKNEYPKKGFENDYYDVTLSPANFPLLEEGTINVDSDKFYKVLEDAIEKEPSSKVKTFNYIIVACGEDLFDIDIAKKIKQKAQEWDLVDGSELKIFVRVKNDYLSEMTTLENDNEYEIIPFGYESEVLNLGNIVNLELENLALRRHIKYTEGSYVNKDEKITKKINQILENPVYKNIKVSSDLNKKIEMIALYDWFYKWNQNKRESNIYSALNIRFKLNLLGFDIAQQYDKESYDNLSLDFYNKYGKNTNTEFKDMNVKGARRYLAIQEHFRWNAYMICNGFLPARKSKLDELYSKYGEGYKDVMASKRYHLNITSMKGLEDYMMHITYLKDNTKFSREDLEKALANVDVNHRNKIMELSKDEDVFRWDFEFMDKIIDLLPKIGLGLINHNYKNINEEEEK